MKNFIFASAALCVAATISAQEVEVVEVQPQPQEAQSSAATKKAYKTEAGRFGVEAAIDLKDGFSFKEKDYIAGEGFDGFHGGRITATYTLSDQLALRCGFGLHVFKTYVHENVIENNLEHEGIKTTSDTKHHTTNSQFEVLPGVVYSFKGTERLEPYVGVEGAFGFDKSRIVDKEDITSNDADVEDVNTKSKKTNTGVFFGANGFTGFNFFLCKDLFIGAEFGFGFRVTPTDRIEKEKREGFDDDSEKEEDNDNKRFAHNTEINMLFHPSIRLGWRF
jgi:hypothetical protein